MFVEWKDPAVSQPPLGKPLIVTIRREWQKPTETLACACYYMVDPRDGKRYFFEAGDIQNGMIGPESVKVYAWDYWPEAYQIGDVYSRD